MLVLTDSATFDWDSGIPTKSKGGINRLAGGDGTHTFFFSTSLHPNSYISSFAETRADGNAPLLPCPALPWCLAIIPMVATKSQVADKSSNVGMCASALVVSMIDNNDGPRPTLFF